MKVKVGKIKCPHKNNPVELKLKSIKSWPFNATLPTSPIVSEHLMAYMDPDLRSQVEHGNLNVPANVSKSEATRIISDLNF